MSNRVRVARAIPLPERDLGRCGGGTAKKQSSGGGRGYICLRRNFSKILKYIMCRDMRVKTIKIYRQMG